MTIDLGQHAEFIIASYAIFGIVVVGLIVWVVTDGARQRRTLADLEARGIRRRSQADAPPAEPARPESVI